MFDLFADVPDSGFDDDVPAPDGIEWDKRMLLAYEKEILKIYVSDHPLRPYERSLESVTKYHLGDLAEHKGDIKNAVFAGLVASVTVKMTRKGTKMANFDLEDTTGHMECVCFKYSDFEEAIQEDAIVKIKGRFEHSERGDQILAFEVERLDVDSMRETPSNLQISLAAADFDQSVATRLYGILGDYPGNDPVVLYVEQSDGRKFRAELPIKVDAADNLLYSGIMTLFGRPVWKSLQEQRR